MKKNIYNVFLFLAILVMASIHVSAAPETVCLSKPTASVAVGKKITLKVKGTSKKAKWTTSNKKVATVSSNGTVAAKKAGVAKITAKVGGKKLVCRVTVKSSVKSIKCSKSSLVIKSGDASKLKVTARPSNADVEVHWKSSDNGVVTVDQNGNLVAKNAGSAKITAILSDGSGKKATCKIQVVKSGSKSGHARTILTDTEELFTEQYRFKQQKYLQKYGDMKTLLKNTVCISCVNGVKFHFGVNADVVAYQPKKESHWEYVVFLDDKKDLKPFMKSIKSKSGVIGVATDWQLTI